MKANTNGKIIRRSTAIMNKKDSLNPKNTTRSPQKLMGAKRATAKR